ncbi:MAG: hypothetical protein R6W90_09680 [Ignavibacteriaceae bacterium]
MEKYIDRETVHTWCPDCKKEIESVWVLKLESSSVLRFAYFCTNCQKKLGVFSRKGFPPAEVFKSPVKTVNT